MKPVLIFRHVVCEGPGYLGSYLSARGIPYRIINVDLGEPIPRGIAGAAGLVFMGGSMSVNDPLPWIDKQLALIREAHNRSLPVLGHCLGAQLIAKAFGADVRANPVSEIGWLPVERTDARADDGWLAGLGKCFEVFHWHRETFSLPAGAHRLLKSQICDLQAFIIGHTLGLQCHVEMTADMVRDWVKRYQDQLTHLSASVQSRDAITRHLSDHVSGLQKVADRLYGRWIAGLSP